MLPETTAAQSGRRLCVFQHTGPQFGNDIFEKFATDFLTGMPTGCRRWTIQYLSWVLLALKAPFTM